MFNVWFMHLKRYSPDSVERALNEHYANGKKYEPHLDSVKQICPRHGKADACKFEPELAYTIKRTMCNTCEVPNCPSYQFKCYTTGRTPLVDIPNIEEAAEKQRKSIADTYKGDFIVVQNWVTGRT
jgi:hypothetical protein